MRSRLPTMGVLVLAATVLACGGAPSDTSSRAAPSSAAIASNGVNATMTVDSWGGGYCANITLANGGTAATTSWTLVAALNGTTINNAWGATTTASGGQLTLRPVDYDAAIAPGASATLGFCGTGSGSPALASFDAVVPGGPTTVALSVSKAGPGSGTVASTPAGIDCGGTCSASFSAGAVVTLTATPDGASGSTFTGWSGACSGTGACTVTMSAAQAVQASFGTGPASYTVTVVKAGAGSGTVSSSPGGISCGATCAAAFTSGSAVTLSAAAATGSSVAGWSSTCPGFLSGALTVSASCTVTVTFDLAVDPGTPVSVDAGGAASGAFVADAYYSGGSTYSTTSAIDTAQLPGTAPAQAVLQTERYGEFTYTIPNRSPGSAQTVTLYFVESYWTAAGQRTFNVAINGVNALTAFDIYAAAGGPNKAVSRTFNTVASASGQVVIAFTKGGGPDNPKLCALTVAGGSVTTYDLAVKKAGAGGGTVSGGGVDCGSTCGATYAAGTTVTLTATPDASSAFAGWSGACAGTSPTCTVSMTAAQTVTASFDVSSVTTYPLTVTRAGSGGGTVTSTPAGVSCGSTCSATFTSGASVTLTAAAASNATFAGWSGACTGTGSCVVTMTAARAVTATFTAPQPTSFNNPVLWEDLADADVIRVDDTYYYSASTMHYSPGAPVLRSYDLVNWEYVGHSVPSLDFGNAYNLSGGRAYVKGVWASFLNYRKSNKTFYWGGCIHGGSSTYVYTATAVEGPWTRRGQLPCYYDAGLLIDDDDTMYVAYGNTTLNVAQLSADGFSQVRSQVVFNTPSSIGTLEGSRFYKRNGYYYIWTTRPANGQYVLRASSPWGPYTSRQVLLNLGGPISGGGVPHQGGMVQTQNGDWYYMAFVDSYPGGRVPVLAPITWTSDGWPVLTLVNNAWGVTYPFPKVPVAPRQVKAPTGTDTFAGTALGPEWEWNHNPDNTRWSLGNGLRLQTATVTTDLYNARNTLTHRILGPTSTGTIVLDYSAMKDGDRAGLALLRDQSAWVGVRRDSGATRVAFVSNLTMDGSWNTTSTGTEVTSAPVSGGKIWLRLAVDIHPGTGKLGRFSYSTDGVNFTQLGTYTMTNAWQFFMGYRFGIFNYATQSLGGAVTVSSFTLSTP